MVSEASRSNVPRPRLLPIRYGSVSTPSIADWVVGSSIGPHYPPTLRDPLFESPGRTHPRSRSQTIVNHGESEGGVRS